MLVDLPTGVIGVKVPLHRWGIARWTEQEYPSAMRATVWIAAFLILAPATGYAAGQPEVAQGYNPPPAKEGFSYPDCFCTDSKGERVELGDSVCLEIGRRKIWALCDMSVNNPAWRHSEEGCPSV